MPIWTWNLE